MVVSNANANGTVRGKLERLGLASHFDLIVDSQEEGVEKPDHRPFDVALARSGGRAASTFHTGDLYEVDVVGARAAGLAVKSRAKTRGLPLAKMKGPLEEELRRLVHVFAGTKNQMILDDLYHAAAKLLPRDLAPMIRDVAEFSGGDVPF